MVDVVSRSEAVEGSYPGCAVVGNNFLESSPATEDILEEKVRYNVAALRSSSSCFGPRGKSTAAVEDVSVGTALRHVERVEVSLAEDRWDVGNGRWDVEILCLADLALMASSNVPADVVVQERPPESKKDVLSRSESTLVSEFVVELSDDFVSLRWRRYLLDCSLPILSE